MHPLFQLFLAFVILRGLITLCCDDSLILLSIMFLPSIRFTYLLIGDSGKLVRVFSLLIMDTGLLSFSLMFNIVLYPSSMVMIWSGFTRDFILSLRSRVPDWLAKSAARICRVVFSWSDNSLAI